MKKLLSVLCFLAFISSVYADNDSDAPALPQAAMEQVKELDVMLRYFKAIGFHTQSNEKREEIVTIYEKYGVPLPDKYKK